MKPNLLKETAGGRGEREFWVFFFHNAYSNKCTAVR